MASSRYCILNNKKVAVFCGSSLSTNQDITFSVKKLGEAFADSNVTLIYGGGTEGLMGVLADSVLHSRGSVIGVIPDDSGESKYAHQGLTELLYTQSTDERKRALIKMSEAIVLLPGGIGALDEFFYAWMMNRLGFAQQEIIVLNISGFYNHLLELLNHCKLNGLIKEKDINKVVVVDSISRFIAQHLES